MTAPDFREALDAAVRRGSHNVRTRDQSRNEAITDAVLALLAERLGGDEVREVVDAAMADAADSYVDADLPSEYRPYTDAALAALRDHLGVTR